MRLVSEAPKAKSGSRRASIEQISVDLVAEKLVRNVISQGDLPDAFATIFDRYAVDQASTFRYAQRRNKAPDLRYLLGEAGVELYA